CQEVTADCNDNNPCTTDTCDATTGCTHTNKSGGGIAGCDDGQACNGVEQCVNGTCQHQAVLDCDDDDSCTDDSCADASGCVHTDKTSFDGIRCGLADMRAEITAGAGAAGNNPHLLTQLGKKIDKLTAKVGTAATPGTKCGKAKRLVSSVAKTLRGLQKTINRAAGRK